MRTHRTPSLHRACLQQQPLHRTLLLEKLFPVIKQPNQNDVLIQENVDIHVHSVYIKLMTCSKFGALSCNSEYECKHVRRKNIEFFAWC